MRPLSSAPSLEDVTREFASIVASFDEVVDAGTRRTALARIWKAAVEAPDKLNVEYRTLSQDELEPSVTAARDALDEGGLLLPAGRSWKDLALAVGAQLAALDAALADTPAFFGSAAGPGAFLVSEAGLHVIPRSRAKRGLRAGPGAGFRRRATPHHRLLPVEIEGFRIELVSRPQLARPTGAAAGTLRMGAALLPGISLTPVEGRPDWVAGAAPCLDEKGAISAQVDGAYDDGVFAALWPELSMPPGRFAMLQEHLSRRSARMEATHGPRIVAAGSWHEERDGTMRNVMRILDSSGMQQFEFWKITAYSVGQVHEGAVAHNVIPVLITDEALVTFAICLDFCDLETTFKYDLDVDLVLVPSHGNRKTMSGHASNAGRLNATTGGSAFVVQHSEEDPPVGWVLPGVDEKQPGMLDENRTWSVREVPSG